jgi:Flp pilus assembly protein TadD
MDVMHSITPEECLKQGISKTERGDFIGAIQAYTQAIQLDANYAWAYGNRGVLRAQQGDSAGALKDYESAAKLFLAQGSVANHQMVLSYIKKLASKDPLLSFK